MKKQTFRKYLRDYDTQTLTEEEQILLEGTINDLFQKAKLKLKSIAGKEIPTKKSNVVSYDISDNDVDKIKSIVKTGDDNRLMKLIDELVKLRLLKWNVELGLI